jgi:hypothetical protein
VRVLCGDAIEVTLAYCAGVIDSDGCIRVKRSTYAMRVTGDAGQPTYSELVCVKQVTPEAVDLLHGLFGGRRAIEGPSAKRGRPLHVWQVTDKRATACLRALLPYLRIKRQHAENCLELRRLKDESRAARTCFGRGHVGGKVRPQEISEAMQATHVRAKSLNVVGRVA